MHKLLLIPAMAALALVVTSCTLGQDSGGSQRKADPGSLAKKGALSGASLTVGSKEFTEQQILCEITAQALESAGATVKRSCGMSGTNPVRTALTSGNIDMYWEYTGTAWVTHLKQTKPLNDPKAQFEAVKQQDLEKNQVVWLAPSTANNTYAIAASSEKATELGIKTISDYARLAKSDPAKASFCGASEFYGRDDGWPGVEKAYGFSLARGNRSEMALGPIPAAIDKSRPCNFGEVFATDGRIAALGLTVLTDDKAFFTPYNPALTVRKEVADKYPQLTQIMGPVTQALDEKTLQTLNGKVDADGLPAPRVAGDWLRQRGFIK